MFFVDFYQNNVIPDLTDTIPGNHVFAGRPPETEAEIAGAGDYNCGNTAGFTVEFHIYRIAQGAAGTDIDHFFLF